MASVFGMKGSTRKSPRSGAGGLLQLTGLGKNVVIIDGANSDSLIAFQQDTKKWIRMTVPIP
jgi:hypothetical protein